MIRTEQIEVDTRPDTMYDLTGDVQAAVDASGCRAGIAVIFVAHTTAAVTISEVEPGLMADIHEPLERIAPVDLPYKHNALHADDNAHSHLRATVLGHSLTVPFAGQRLTLGTWQRIVLLELDTHPRTRRVVIQVLGE